MPTSSRAMHPKPLAAAALFAAVAVANPVMAQVTDVKFSGEVGVAYITNFENGVNAGVKLGHGAAQN